MSKLTGDRVFDSILEECIKVMSTKGVDYAAGSADRLYNFREAARDLGLPMEQVLYIYLWKHLTSIKRFCKNGVVESETIESRIVDAINYLLILAKIIDEKKA